MKTAFVGQLLALCALASSLGTGMRANFSNPVIWNDLADIDLTRVGDTFYYSASSMHFSPGAPILTSKDLVNWEYLAHSVPVLNFSSPAYSLEDGMRAYARGVWASTLRYRESNGLWYYIGCVDFNATYFHTSPSAAGPWTQAAVLNGNCLYDCGMLIDKDDKMYVTHGSTDLSVSLLTPDGLSVAKTVQVWNGTLYIEGSRLYRRKNNYYIISDAPVTAQYVLKSTTGPFGPYEINYVLNETHPPSALAGGDVPHQGAFVDTPAGDWYYMSFVDQNGDSTGRVPVLSSITWSDDDWPILDLLPGNTWPETLPYPVNSGAKTPNSQVSLIGTDYFANGLGPQFEWNHNPNADYYHVTNHGIRLFTATVTDDIYQARNTLTHRTLGPASAATIRLNFHDMLDGDRAGLALFRDSSAWIGVAQDNGTRSIVMRSNMTMDGTNNWATISTGTDMASKSILNSTHHMYFKCTADFRNYYGGGNLQAQFSYSINGEDWHVLGGYFTMVTDWQFFQGYRWAVFNYATKAMGGNVMLKQFGVELIDV